MSQNKTSDGSPAIDDPRGNPDFLPTLYPTANGGSAPPPGASEQNERITLEFLSVYYDLNRKYAQLLKVRAQPDSPLRAAADTEALRALEQTLIQRDQLEDLYAPYGVIAQPVVQNGFTVDVILAFANVDRRDRNAAGTLTFAAHLAIPLPEEESAADDARTNRMP